MLTLQASQELWQRVMAICEEKWQCLTIVSITEQPKTEQEECLGSIRIEEVLRSLRRSVDILLRSASFKQEGHGASHHGAMCYPGPRRPQQLSGFCG